MEASSKICCYAKYEIVGDVKTNLHHRRRQLNNFLRMKCIKMILYTITRVTMFTIVVRLVVTKILSDQSKFLSAYIEWISIFKNHSTFVNVLV